MKKRDTLEQALFAFRHAITTALLAEAKQAGCTVSHMEVIHRIAEHGALTLKDIAAGLHITSPSASVLVDALVARGLVVRETSPSDRRAVSIALAPKALTLLASMHRHKKSVFDTMLAKLDLDDKRELARILIKSIS